MGFTNKMLAYEEEVIREQSRSFVIELNRDSWRYNDIGYSNVSEEDMQMFINEFIRTYKYPRLVIYEGPIKENIKTNIHNRDMKSLIEYLMDLQFLKKKTIGYYRLISVYRTPINEVQVTIQWIDDL